MVPAGHSLQAPASGAQAPAERACWRHMRPGEPVMLPAQVNRMKRPPCWPLHAIPGCRLWCEARACFWQPFSWQLCDRHSSCESCTCRPGPADSGFLQVALGIATLMTYVRPELGASHQASALALFTVALALLHSLRGSAAAPSVLSRIAGPAAAVGVAGVAVAVSSLQ